MKAPLVKLCGLRTVADVTAACEAGADAVGFVLCASPRRVVRAELVGLLDAVPPGVLRVAVMGPPEPALVALANSLPFDVLQCEVGDAPTPRVGERRSLLPVFRDGADVETRVARYFALAPDLRDTSSRAHALDGALVLDGPLGGGRGVGVDVARAARLAARHPLVLAGGLTPENVGERVRGVRPLAVDVSSGIERTRGQKDARRMRAFADAARSSLSDSAALGSAATPIPGELP